jgi:hypothetical protein
MSPGGYNATTAAPGYSTGQWQWVENQNAVPVQEKFLERQGAPAVASELATEGNVRHEMQS